MKQPIEVHITKEAQIFSFQQVRGDQYEITRDGDIAYGMISKEEGETIMKALPRFYP